MTRYGMEFGIKPNDVEVWAFGVGNLPIIPRKGVKAAIKFIGGLEGFIGVHPAYPHGTFCIFRTENDAKRGMNLTKAEGIAVGGTVVKLYIDKSFVERLDT